MSTNVLVQCNKCGNIWSVNPHHLLHGHGCRKCATKQRDCSKNTRKTTQEFIHELTMKNANVEVIGEYVNARTDISCKCKICGNVWSARPTNLLAGYGCPKCGDYQKRTKQAKTQHDFIVEMMLVNPDIEIAGEYINNHTNIKCRCVICDNIWYATPSNLLRGTGCPLHNHSHGEEAITRWLQTNSIYSVRQKKFYDLTGIGHRPLPYDFYIPQHNMLIEYQGNFHDKTDRLQTDADFATRTCHDKLKKDYALSHGFKFAEIWYNENIEEKLKEIFDITNPVTTTVT